MTRAEAGKIGGEKSKTKTQERFNARVEKYLCNPKQCFCAKIMSYSKRHNKFCSQSCAASFNNRDKPKHGIKKILHACEICGTMVKNTKFCSQKCSWKSSKKKIVVLIESGIYTCTCNITLRKYLLTNRGHKCENCNLTTWMNEKIPLDVHHENGKADDNSLENLKLLCKNCHALTPNYGGKNKCSTRTWRYEK